MRSLRWLDKRPTASDIALLTDTSARQPGTRRTLRRSPPRSRAESPDGSGEAGRMVDQCQCRMSGCGLNNAVPCT
eukprot:3890485-Alexandrium_andersonii.AAC.1